MSSLLSRCRTRHPFTIRRSTNIPHAAYRHPFVFGVSLALIACCAIPSGACAGGRKKGNVQAKQTKVDTEEMRVTVSGSEVYCLAAGPKDGHPILLMHGARFDAHTWLTTNTIQDLVTAGYRVFAIDIPGFSHSPRATLYANSFTDTLLGELTKEPAIIVTPSLSGRFGFPPAIASSPKVAGWVAVAPAAMDYHKDNITKIKLPTLIIWGSKDAIFPVAQADVLAKAIAGSKKVVLEGANHPCYLDKPEQFNKEIMDFAASVFRERKTEQK